MIVLGVGSTDEGVCSWHAYKQHGEARLMFDMYAMSLID